jgi:5-keto-L-gluconate epimerase
MKLAVAVAGENAMPSAFVVWRGFEDSIRKASEYGYHGVELALKTSGDVNPEHLSKWLDKWKIEVSCNSTGQVFADLGLYFTHPDPYVRKKAIDVFSGLINLAKDFGKLVNVGRARGFIAEGQSREEAENIFLDTTEKICEVAAKNHVEIILEPVNRYEINFINNLDEGRLLLSKLKASNIRLMPDVFHMNIEDDKIGASLIRNSLLVRYIHFADSNRLAPGQGHIDFEDIFKGLKAINFDGWASIEILPKPDPDTAAMQAAQFILPRIKRYNEEMSIK